jgi:hypothetical protein
MKNIFKILIIVFAFAGCKNENKKTELVEKPVTEVINLPKLIVKAPLEIPKNVDEDFNTFLKFFNKDSVFQVSRVKFPLEITELETDNFESIKRIIKSNNYRMVQLIDNKDAKTAAYSLVTNVKNNKVIIEIKGIDNGIYNEFEFEKINGKWMLITWNDQST